MAIKKEREEEEEEEEDEEEAPRIVRSFDIAVKHHKKREQKQREGGS